MKAEIAILLILLLVGAGAWALRSGESVTQDEQCAVQPAPLKAEAASEAVYPGTEWTWAKTPESLGWSSEKLERAQAFSEAIGSAAVMIVDHGVVVDAWGDLTLNYHCHSMRKSLISALYGIYVSEGKIDLSATLADLGIDDIVPLTDVEKQATVVDLLEARSGIYIPAAGESADMIATRPQRGSHAPGTFWYYNNWDFNALGTIFDQLSGEDSIYQAFEDRIAAPIGMQDFHPEDLAYSYVDSSMHPYYGFDMSTRDLARFGLLFLREGRWEDRQIVPAEWVQKSTTSYSSRSAEGGYGYMWWTGTGGGLFPNVTVPAPCYYASGAGGHRVVVLPYRNLVIVHRVDTFALTETVTEEEFGALLWMILDAAGETDIGDSPFMDQALGVRMEGEDLRQAISGNTLHRVGDIHVSAAFAANHVLSMLVDGSVVVAGWWAVQDNRLVVDVPGTDISGSYTVYGDGDILRAYEPTGLLSAAFRVEEGLPEGL